MREILDPVEPESLRPIFKQSSVQLQRGKALEEMVFVQGHYLLALDGTGYFSSHRFTVRPVWKRTIETAPSPIAIRCWARPSSIPISAR